jgi:hypothetical protein
VRTRDEDEDDWLTVHCPNGPGLFVVSLNETKGGGRLMSNRPTESEYLLLVRNTRWYEDLSPEEMQQAMNGLFAWFDRLSREGKVRSTRPLEEEVQVVSAERTITDGPFPESKEVIGGFAVISAESLEEAVEIAKRRPCLDYGETVEVRPIAQRRVGEWGNEVLE